MASQWKSIQLRPKKKAFHRWVLPSAWPLFISFIWLFYQTKGGLCRVPPAGGFTYPLGSAKERHLAFGPTPTLPSHYNAGDLQPLEGGVALGGPWTFLFSSQFYMRALHSFFLLPFQQLLFDALF